MQVDGDEAFERLRDAADPRPLQSRKRDDAIGQDDAAADEQQLALSSLRWIRPLVQGDPALVEQLAHGAARRSPNSWSGSSSGVTSATSTPAMPRAASQVAVISASS